MKKMKWYIALILNIFLLASCQTGIGDEQLQLQHYYDANDSAKYEADYDILDKGPVAGGVLNLFTTEPDTLNPILTKNTYVSDFLSFIYEGLTRLGEGQKAVPVLSDSWSVSSDGLVWNFHIRNGVKWQDEQPFTAFDVEFTIQVLLNTGVDSVYKPLVMNIAAFSAVDSSNIRIVLKNPNSFIPEMMTFPILAKHQFLQKDIISASKNFSPIGTGPYRYTSYTEKKRVELKSNENWWYLNAEDSKAKDGMFMSTISINIFNDSDEAMGAFQAGEIDVAAIETGNFSKYKGRSDLIIKKYTSRNFEFIAFNLKNPILADIYVRKAIALAIDRERVIGNTLPGEAVASDIAVLPDSWISDMEGISAGASAIYSIPESINKAVNPQNGNALEAAAVFTAKTPKEALLQGGWKESVQGYYKIINGVRKYLKFELIVNSNNSLRVKAAQEVCTQLKQAGIETVCTQIQWNDFLARVNASKFDMVFTGCRVPQIPDVSYLYSSSYLPAALPARSDSARNISGYYNVQLNESITALFRENDTDKRKVLYDDIRQIITNDTAYIGLYFLRDAMVYGRNIRGPLEPDTWNRYKDMTHWYKPEVP